MISKQLFFILSLLQVLLVVHSPLFAQKSSLGREFYVGFMDNNRRNTQPDKTIIILTANEKSSGIIATSKQSFPFSLEAGQQLIREFDGNDEGLIHRESGVVSYKPLRITSSGDLAVHAINGREYSSDGTVVLPVTALGKDYFVTAHFDVFGPGQSPGSNQNFESTMLVMAIENDTQIEIIPAANTVNTIPAGSAINVVLNAGESYQVKANGDLTGSRVRVINGDLNDCKLIAVFGGNKTTSAGTCGTSGDHLFQQAYPIESWGKSFIHIPLEGRTSGEIVKVLASQNGTVVRSNGTVVGTLNAGKFLKLDYGKNEIGRIETSKPATVAVIAKSAACNEFGIAPLGDPSLFTLSPNNQLLKSLTFSAGKLIGAFNQDIIHYLGILVPKGAATKTILNGQNVGSQFAPVPGAEFEYARIRIGKGVNSVSNSEGFIGYAYGAGSIESYGFSIGTSLESIQYEIENSYDFEVEGEKVACLGQEGTWKILPDNPKFNKFTWNFGDQSPDEIGQVVDHKFEKTGKFKVSVIASTGEDHCDSEEKFTFEVEVKDVIAKIQGPSSVCPGMDEFTYSVIDRNNFQTALWSVVGGQVLSSSDTTVTVKWDGKNPEASVKVIPVALNGCQGETEILVVEITDSIKPAKPKGQEGICGLQIVPVEYQIPFPLLGKQYNWVVEGGKLISGQSTTTVSVLWDNSASKRNISYEESSISNPLCFGRSELLELVDFKELRLEANQVTQPSCPGAKDGVVELKVIGGSGKFGFKWAHDPTLKSHSASGLAAGTYEVELTDFAGCGIKIIGVTLKDPEPLAAKISSISFVSCFGASDGEVLMDLTGGTPPYTILGYQSVLTGKQIRILNLRHEQYSFDVVDSKGCLINIAAEVKGPEELTLSFEEESPGCPGDPSGALRVIPSGGTAPYSFTWLSGSSSSELVSGLSSGEYGVIVKDASGCEVRGSGTISEAVPQVRMPTGFIPSQGFLIPIATCEINYSMMIYNRWGQLVHSGISGWDGSYQGNDMPHGIYSYVLTFEYSTDSGSMTKDIMGSFTLIR